MNLPSSRRYGEPPFKDPALNLEDDVALHTKDSYEEARLAKRHQQQRQQSDITAVAMT
jgi:hypothetical protein